MIKTSAFDGRTVTSFSAFVVVWVALLGISGLVMWMPSAKAAWVERVKSRAEEVPYSFLAGLPEQYQNKTVVFRGTVVQAVDSMLRVNMSLSSNDIVWVDYTPGRPRIREGDRVRVWGTYAGIGSYTAVLGQKIQLPHVVADIVE